MVQQLADALSHRILQSGDAYTLPLDQACGVLRDLACAPVPMLRLRPELAAALWDSVAFRLADTTEAAEAAVTGAAAGQDLPAGSSIGGNMEEGALGGGTGHAGAPLVAVLEALAAGSGDPWVSHLVRQGALDELAIAVQRAVRLGRPESISTDQLVAMLTYLRAPGSFLTRVKTEGGGAAGVGMGPGGLVSGGEGSSQGGLMVGSGRLLRAVGRVLVGRVGELGPAQAEEVVRVYGTAGGGRDAGLLLRVAEAAERSVGRQYSVSGGRVMAVAITCAGSSNAMK